MWHSWQNPVFAKSSVDYVSKQRKGWERAIHWREEATRSADGRTQWTSLGETNEDRYTC